MPMLKNTAVIVNERCWNKECLSSYNVIMNIIVVMFYGGAVVAYATHQFRFRVRLLCRTKYLYGEQIFVLSFWFCYL